jgi:hypothetical protein
LTLPGILLHENSLTTPVPLFLFRDLDDGEEQTEHSYGIGQFIVLHRFRDIDIASQFIAPGYFLRVVCCCQNNNGDLLGAGIVFDDLQDLVSVKHRKVEVEQDEERRRMGIVLVPRPAEQESTAR